MLISIITPVYNSAATIADNVKSVINQSFKDFEQIIVDNLSSDNSLEIALQLYREANIEEKLRIISEKDAGISDAFNKGIAAAAGEVITILNSDDYYYNNMVFEKVVKEFNDPGLLYVHGNIYFMDPVHGSNIRKPLLCSVTTAMPINHPTLFLRSSLYKEYGVFDTSYKYAMDYELIIRYEKMIKDFRNRGKYLDGDPIAVMSAGGASWKHEMTSLHESKRALKTHGFWNYDAQKNNLFRVIRTRLKKVLSLFRLNSVIKFWRKKKWEA